MPLPPDFIYSLKQNNPIESVMGSYASLKKQSRDYICLCPFHSEKTPSCHVRPAEGYFHCFGCGAGGDVISLVMRAENLAYIEAVKFLAERAGMAMPEEARDNGLSRKRTRILEANRCAAKHFSGTLLKSPHGEKGRRYFAERQLTPKTLVKYGLGYAPDSWSELLDHMKGEGFSEQELLDADLVSEGKNGGLYDRFRDRVIFPIIDLRGNVLGFGGRIIDGSGPKYLNSSDTMVFKKSRNLFSLNFAKKSGEKRLILAEGYMDVIALNQAGFENAVATLGTALTPEQAKLMSVYAEEVIICYDSDGAGQNAAHRAIDLLSEAGLRTSVIRMEGAKDPDEYIKKFGSLRFGRLLDKSEGAVNFELSKCADGLDMTSETDRVEFLKRSAAVIADLRSPIERDVYISKIAKEQDISRGAVASQVEKLISRGRSAARKSEWQRAKTFADRRSEAPEAVGFPAEYKAEQGVIAYLARNPAEIKNITDRLPPDRFVTEFHRRIYKIITENYENSEEFDFLSLFSEFPPDEMGKITAILSKNDDIDINKNTFTDYIDFLNRSFVSRNERKPPSSMSDEEFLNLANDLLANKK